MSSLRCFTGYDNGRNFKEYTSVNTYGSDKWNFFPLDTRGDGKLGFLVTSASNSWKGYQLYMSNAGFSNLLKSATGSHGNVTTVSYKKWRILPYIQKRLQREELQPFQDMIACLLLLHSNWYQM